LSDSNKELRELLRILLIILAVAQAIGLPERTQIDLFLLIMPGLGPFIKVLEAVDGYDTTHNLTIFFLELFYLLGMLCFQQWLLRKVIRV